MFHNRNQQMVNVNQHYNENTLNKIDPIQKIKYIYTNYELLID